MQRVAFITGGTQGIGASVCLKMAQAGYAIAVSGIADELENGEVMQQLREMGTPCFYITMFLQDAQSRQRAIDAIYDHFGRIDVLVNNAGVAPRERKDLLEMTEESYNFVMGINLQGTFMLTQLVARRMIEQPKVEGPMPCIVTISSISSFTASINRGEYCMSKAGLSMMTKLFADRLAEEGVRVYEIQPGIIATDMTSGVKAKYDALIDGGLTPIRRWGQADDVANAIVGVCSGLFAFSTGEVIHVDGGFHVRRL